MLCDKKIAQIVIVVVVICLIVSFIYLVRSNMKSNTDSKKSDESNLWEISSDNISNNDVSKHKSKSKEVYFMNEEKKLYLSVDSLTGKLSMSKTPSKFNLFTDPDEPSKIYASNEHTTPSYVMLIENGSNYLVSYVDKMNNTVNPIFIGHDGRLTSTYDRWPKPSFDIGSNEVYDYDKMATQGKITRMDHLSVEIKNKID